MQAAVKAVTAGKATLDVKIVQLVKLLRHGEPVKMSKRSGDFVTLREVIDAIERHRSDVFFPIEVRSIAADDAWLSTFHGRESGSIAVHAYYKDDYTFFYTLIEPILRRHGGRPHWGKLNSLKYDDFAALYPRWKDAMAVRDDLDPEGKLINPYLLRVLRRG